MERKAMSEIFFFILGIINSIILITIFLIRKSNLDRLQRYGKFYFLLVFPAATNIFLVFHENGDTRYVIFLALFLTFLLIEWLYDYKFKIGFRENWLKNWKWTLPYLGLYYAVNYGFVVMPWKTDITWGIIMMCLFVIQIITNIRSHPRIKS